MSEFKRFTTKVERKIAKRLIKELLKRGYIIDVHDGEDVTGVNLCGSYAVRSHLATTGSDQLIFRKPGQETTGWFYLIWGNGADLISDYSANPISEDIAEDVGHWIDRKFG